MLAGTRVLVIDDDPHVRDALEFLLSQECAECVIARNAEEGLACAAARDFDVVLVDLGLPDLPGETVIRRILEGARARPRVLVITAHPESEHAPAWQAGADMVFMKPFEWAAIRDAIGAANAGPDAKSTAA